MVLVRGAAVCGRRTVPSSNIQYLGTIRQQSKHRKNTLFRLGAALMLVPERLQIPNDAEIEDLVQSHYNAVLTWLWDRCNRPPVYLGIMNKSVIASTGFAAASNAPKTQCDHFRQISAEFWCDSQVRKSVHHLPAAPHWIKWIYVINYNLLHLSAMFNKIKKFASHSGQN